MTKPEIRTATVKERTAKISSADPTYAFGSQTVISAGPRLDQV